MPIGTQILKGASRLLFLGAATLLMLAGLSAAEASRVHRRATSVYGAAPAYWSYERPAATRRDVFGRRVLRLRPGDARVSQLDPRLRGSDGRLAEHLSAVPPSGTPPPPEYYLPWFYDGAPAATWWRGYWRHYRSLYRRR